MRKLDFSGFDWRSLQKYFNSQSANDLNSFLENLPQKAGYNALIAAGIAWMMAMSLGLYAAVQVQKMIEMRAELMETGALKPLVPTIKDVPVPQKEIKAFTSKLKATYRGLTVKQQGSSIFIAAASTGQFAQFREAIGHTQNGGTGWRVSVERLCVGRECDREKLAALLKINKVTVDMPK